MILDAFSLQGKVAVVSGCDTGLGQGMALGLAEAGCDIVGINIVEPVETIERVTALGRRFLSLTADLRQIDGIPQLLERAVAEFGHIDILVNNAGLIRREDALAFSEKDWDDVMNLNIKSVFSCPRRRRSTLSPRAAAGRSLTSPPCCHSRAGSACHRIRRPKER